MSTIYDLINENTLTSSWRKYWMKTIFLLIQKTSITNQTRTQRKLVLFEFVVL